MNSIELSLFTSRLNAVCDEMGAVLQRAAFSPNIRDRLDFSCAIFDAAGELCAQAAHIPVHLGSMAYAMQGIVTQIDWHVGDMVIVNDPFLGGTHLPDITLIAPVFYQNKLIAFIVNRAHHADIGADSPGSMPLSKSLDEEGIIIPPTHLIKKGEMNTEFMNSLLGAIRSGGAAQGDFAAQVSANITGVTRLELMIASLCKEEGEAPFLNALTELNHYGERLAHRVIEDIPDGEYSFSDVMDDDGLGHFELKIAATITVKNEKVYVDFAGTCEQTEGNINCPLSVAAAAVYYVFRCLMPKQTPACAGTFRPITLSAPEGSLVNAKRPAAVAAGNVETSTRLVDVVMGALAKALPNKIPAASHGSMNNLAMGSASNGANNHAWDYYESNDITAWDYYETIGGGMGASSQGDGIDAVQTHMTNTRNTPIEVMETSYPVRIKKYAIRKNSGGHGLYKGGDGLIREFEFLKPTNVTLLTERRLTSPWGLNGGLDGACGQNTLNGTVLTPKTCIDVNKGDVLTIKTPGGGGWGKM